MPFPALLAAATALFVAPPQAGTVPPELAKILDVKPFPVADSDGALLKLQKERFNARLEATHMYLQAVRAGALNTQQL